MHYVSTRGRAPALNFKDVTLTGLAEDGGLYVPESFPQLPQGLNPLHYGQFAADIMQAFVQNEVPNFKDLVQSSYQNFQPVLKQLDDDFYVLELFHGPTLAFKDFALQFLGRLFGALTNDKLRVVGATSGDTGSAAMEGCKHAKNADIFILYPHERPSEVQRRQMTTVNAPNVHALAVKGSFDDCQHMVKTVLNDPAMRAKHRLVAVNSINWARILAQVAYYAWACAQFKNQHVHFVVPTGNFGNVYAGYVAKRMGATIAGLHIATNANDALHRIFTTGKMQAGNVYPTLSPSMDIQIPSNFERYLFECAGRDGAAVQNIMRSYAERGEVALPGLGSLFTTSRHNDAQTLNTMEAVYKKYGYVLDPHTAVAVDAALELRGKQQGPVVALGCAHPAKFPDAVKKATGITPELPVFLSDLYERSERFEVMETSTQDLVKRLS